MSMESSEQRRIIEALVVGSPDPISATRLAQIVPDCTPAAVREMVDSLNAEYQANDRSFEIWEVAGGYQIRTRAEFSGYLQQLQKQRPLRLSQAALDTLAIVAFKQPVTRGELEGVRGVDSGAVLRSLLERRLLRIAGHREVPGRPMLYGTTRRFLEVFGLESLKQLPSLREVEALGADREVEGLDAEPEPAGRQEESATEDACLSQPQEAAPGNDPASEVETLSASTEEEPDGSAEPNRSPPATQVGPTDAEPGA
jgi:segregation and condensation protein B